MIKKIRKSWQIPHKSVLLITLISLVAGANCKRPPQSSHDLAASVQANGSTRGKDYAEINSSVAVLGEWDYALQDGTSRCMRMVDTALSDNFSNSMINFIPTHGFVPEEISEKLAPIAKSSRKEYPDAMPITFGNHICYRTTGNLCIPPTKSMIQVFEDGMTACFKRVFERGKGISLIPHLDGDKREKRWRNSHALDPIIENDWNCQKHHDSYYCAMLKPLVNAINRARTGDSLVNFATQGEMGATIFAYPSQYLKAIKLIREDLSSSGPKRLNKVGISLNFNKIFGYYPTSHISSKDFKNLLKNIDFLGASAYIGLESREDGSVNPNQFDEVFTSINQELAAIQIDIKKDGPHLELHFSEVGLGGSANSVKPAQSGQEALKAPWGGIHGTFDPKRNPWADQEVANSARAFYCSLSRYLSRQPDRLNPPQKNIAAKFDYKWKIHYAFIWNLASWDIQGLYHESSRPKSGSYRIPNVADGIRTYNLTGNDPCSPTKKTSP